MTQKPLAALFDMDGLLLDTERVAQASFIDVARTFGIENAKSESMFMELIGHNSADNARQMSGFLPDDRHIESFRRDWDKGFAALIAQDVPLRPHARDVIETLAAAGTIMAVVTSSNTERAREKLERVGLLEAFVTVIGGDAVEANKPDPAPYLMGAKAVGFAPKDCVAFEDSDPGVHSAIAAGCRVWQVPDLRSPDQPFPDLGQGMAETLRDAVLAARLLDDF